MPQSTMRQIKRLSEVPVGGNDSPAAQTHKNIMRSSPNKGNAEQKIPADVRFRSGSNENPTPSGNTGLDSQKGFSVGLDWLDFICRKIQSGQEVQDFISSFEVLFNDQFDFSTSRPTFHGKKWAGSGRSAKGILAWYNPPVSSVAMKKALPCGNLPGYPDLLPPQHIPLEEADILAIYTRLPLGAELKHSDSMRDIWMPSEGAYYPAHGWWIDGSNMPIVDRPGELKISICATALAHCDIYQLLSMCAIWRDCYGLEAIRVDGCIDDHEKQIPLELIEKAGLDNNFAHVSTYASYASKERGGELGKCLYFGANSSDAKLRAYNKTLESKGKVLGNRSEGQFRREKAKAFFDELLSGYAANPDFPIALFIASRVLGIVRFCDRSLGDKNIYRCPLLPWYQQYLDLLGADAMRVRAPQSVPSIQRSIDNIVRLGASIATVAVALGSDASSFFENVIEEGKGRLSILQRKMLDTIERDQLVYDLAMSTA